MRSGVAFLLLAASFVAACTAPGIGEYPEGEASDLPPRETPGEEEEKEEKQDPPAAVTPSKPTITISLSGVGKGTITSTPGGLTCEGTSCKGEFAKGTTVTLVAQPAAGAIFSGFTGACTGTTSCSPKLDADVTLGASFQTLAGSWSGTYDHSQVGGNNCTFKNKGNLTTTLTDPAAAGGKGGTTAQFTGLELRNGNCNLVSVENGTTRNSSDLTTEGANISGTWTLSIPNASGTLPLPFSATIEGNTLKGKWTCNGCTGSFTLTKQ